MNILLKNIFNTYKSHTDIMNPHTLITQFQQLSIYGQFD